MSAGFAVLTTKEPVVHVVSANRYFRVYAFHRSGIVLRRRLAQSSAALLKLAKYFPVSRLGAAKVVVEARLPPPPAPVWIGRCHQSPLNGLLPPRPPPISPCSDSFAFFPK